MRYWVVMHHLKDNRITQDGEGRSAQLIKRALRSAIILRKYHTSTENASQAGGYRLQAWICGRRKVLSGLSGADHCELLQG